MAFVKYTLKTKSLTPRASVKPTGIIAFNSAARAMHRMDKSSYAVLYYDAGAKLIGVQLTTDAKADGARKVRLQQSGAAVSTRGFAEFFGISIPEAVTVDVGKDSKTGYLTLALANGKPSRKGARSK